MDLEDYGNATLWNSSNEDMTTDSSIKLSPAASIAGVALGILVVALGTFGNVLVVLAVVFSKPLLKASNIFIVSLAVCDLFQTVMVRPLYIHTYVVGSWEFGAKVCQYALYASNLATLESILHVSTIAFYRYIIIVHPTAARKFHSPRAFVTLIVLIYVIPLLVILLPSLPRLNVTPAMNRDVSFNTRIMFCVYNKFSSKQDQFSGSLVGIIKKAAFLFCTAGFLFYCYIRIYHVVRVSGRVLNNTQGAVYSTTRLRREMTLLKTVIVVFLAFVISYLPVTLLYGVDKTTTIPDMVYVIAVLLLWTSSSINWMIYGLMNRQFLMAYRAVLCGLASKYRNNSAESVSAQKGSRQSCTRELQERRRISRERIRRESSPESAISVD